MAVYAEGGDDEDERVSTHIAQPKRWFETRETLSDAVSLDYTWVASFMIATLRQLQMARQWQWQAEIALSFDDLTEGHFASQLMPFLEQAQQKIAASKWCDGEPLAQVARRVAELERDRSACVQMIERCRQNMHALQTKGGGLKDLLGLSGGAAAAEEGMAKAQELWKECATLCLGETGSHTDAGPSQVPLTLLSKFGAPHFW